MHYILFILFGFLVVAVIVAVGVALGASAFAAGIIAAGKRMEKALQEGDSKRYLWVLLVVLLSVGASLFLSWGPQLIVSLLR